MDPALTMDPDTQRVGWKDGLIMFFARLFRSKRATSVTEVAPKSLILLGMIFIYTDRSGGL